ncbi:MAG TPA: ArsA-related P-loop ATPase, partial [Ilumatobacteraceae bacterium]|nr:ArsA-related P-loop ATPase [Ilumatobacteraceae bacterium]
MARTAARQRAGLTALLAAKEMVLVCGSGGVGKTTTAAAMAVQAATEIGGRVLVLTVDPARRLADALGVGAIGNEARLVPSEAFASSGVEPRG